MDPQRQQQQEEEEEAAALEAAAAGAESEADEEGGGGGGAWVESLFRILSEAAVSVVDFVGQQARSLAAAVAAHTAVLQEAPPEIDGPMHMRVWYAVWDNGAEAARQGSLEAGPLGAGERPRRSRRPAQPPGLASQALRELQQDARATPTIAGASGSDGAIASAHPLAQLTCSQASTAECAAAAAALTRAAAAAAAAAAPAAALAVRKAPSLSTDGSPLAPSDSKDTCLRITDYAPPGVALSPGAGAGAGAGANAERRESTHQKLTLSALPAFPAARLAFADEPKRPDAPDAPAIAPAPARHRLLL